MKLHNYLAIAVIFFSFNVHNFIVDAQCNWVFLNDPLWPLAEGYCSSRFGLSYKPQCAPDGLSATITRYSGLFL